MQIISTTQFVRQLFKKWDSSEITSEQFVVLTESYAMFMLRRINWEMVCGSATILYGFTRTDKDADRCFITTVGKPRGRNKNHSWIYKEECELRQNPTVEEFINSGLSINREGMLKIFGESHAHHLIK